MNLDFLQPGSTIYNIAEWAQRLVVANLLWILFSLAGLVVLGIMPSTAALYSIARNWNKDYKNFSLLKTFWREFKKYFVKANLLGIIAFVLGYILFFNINYYRQQTDIMYYLYYLMLAFSFLYILILLYLFPLLINYELKLRHIIKNALFICVLSPVNTFLMLLSLFVLIVALQFLPALIPFFGMSSFAYINMWGSLKSFSKVEQKIKKYQQKDSEDKQDDLQGQRTEEQQTEEEQHLQEDSESSIKNQSNHEKNNYSEK